MRQTEELIRKVSARKVPALLKAAGWTVLAPGLWKTEKRGLKRYTARGLLLAEAASIEGIDFRSSFRSPTTPAKKRARKNGRAKALAGQTPPAEDDEVSYLTSRPPAAKQLFGRLWYRIRTPLKKGVKQPPQVDLYLGSRWVETRNAASASLAGLELLKDISFAQFLKDS